ncbi:SH3 domain-containing protein [Fimbriiglobus ruber]|uniref:SH3b domain-containing protein n=1 Tax=Fimbriiglobus ruber TaxID=1908690 RepID=A0A225E188_9BACT|nr:SH3 domain-containing protein [Fimbriiglobus ruber]OWK36319.1 hypothetical protein FRUB_08882 [Fimbriiglobus ruber]OWK44568.1 hypothetical protein FRUB_02500 [Fimbriiglobus ruber]
MRTALAAVVVFVACATRAAAQPASYVAEVTAESVTVRTGPGEQMPDTGTLPRGTKVIVDHAEGDNWVAIQPPRGQVSWIKNLNLGPVDDQPQQDLTPRNAVVHAEPTAEISYGRPGSGEPLGIRRTKLPDGAIVWVIGRSVDYQNAKWVPIEPPDGDFRYVPVSALQVTKGQPVQSFVVKSPQPASPLLAGEGNEGRSGSGSEPITASVPATPPTKPTLPVRPANWPNHPLWQQAEAAEIAGDTDAAKKLYLQLATEMNRAGGDTELANQCFARVHAIGEKRRLSSGGKAPITLPPLTTATSASVPPPTGAIAESSQPQWLSGTLRASGFRLNDQPTYALEDAQRRVKCYVVAGPGVSLESFRGYEADLFGSIASRDDLRGAGVLTATRIQAVRDR